MRAGTETHHHFLYAGSIFADRRATEVQTVLGSCVSVCLYDTVLQFGGINHFMLPLWNGEGLATPKYGNIAIDKLLEKMTMLGSTKSSLIAKVFGGADVHEGISAYQIGQRNIQMALETLSSYGIPVTARHVGGKSGRKVVYDSEKGIVFLKMITSTNLPEIITQNDYTEDS